MKIGVLSDTHLRGGSVLPAQVWSYLEGVELILHAGDIVSPHVLEELNCLAPVYAVKGNCDGWELSHLPEQEIIEIESARIGLIHGYTGIASTTPERALKAFSLSNVNAIVFGHSHIPYLERKDGILLFNPGSPTDKRRQPQYSLGLMTVDGQNIEARHVYF